MLLNDKQILASSERTCGECGKQFSIHGSDQWIYKLSIKGKTVWFCRYNCFRVAEKLHIIEMKANRKNTGRVIDLNANKPTKESLEKDLRSGLTGAQIAKKYDAKTQTVFNWIRAYGLQGIKGQRKPADKVVATKAVAPRVYEKPVLEKMVQEAPTPAEIELDEIYNSKDVKFYDDMKKYSDMVQNGPTLAGVEQFHTDEVQEIPKMEKKDIPDSLSSEAFDQIMSTVEVQPITTAPTLGEVWETIEENLAIAKKKYIEQADKEFRAQLLQLVLAVTNNQGI